MADPTPPKAPPIAPTLTLETASQAKSLDDIGNLASTMETPGGVAPGAPGAPGAPIAALGLEEVNSALITDALIAGRQGFCVFTELRSPVVTMSDAKCREVGAMWGKWCARRGYDLQQQMGNHADTLTAGLATVMLGFAVYQAAVAELATRKPRETSAPATGQGAAPAPDKPAADNVAFFPGQPHGAPS